MKDPLKNQVAQLKRRLNRERQIRLNLKRKYFFLRRQFKKHSSVTTVDPEWKGELSKMRKELKTRFEEWGVKYVALHVASLTEQLQKLISRVYEQHDLREKSQFRAKGTENRREECHHMVGKKVDTGLQEQIQEIEARIEVNDKRMSLKSLEEICGRRCDGELMGARLTMFCHYYLRHSREEKDAFSRIRSKAAPGPPSDSSDGDTGGGSAGSRVLQNKRSSAREGLDRELQTFISMRDQTDQATEEWEKLNYDIHTLRYAQREVRSRWKKILLLLGYQCEVDALLGVSSQSQFSHKEEEHLARAAELLEQLLDHTSLFPAETGHQSRYLCVMERLVLLDSAEDFVRLAKEKYPKKG